MLRSWRDRYGVALCPDRLLAVRRRTGLRSAVDLKVAESFSAPASGPIWKSAVEALGRFAEQPEVRAGALGIVLSNHFIRYLLVPWSERVVNAVEFRNYVAAAFEDVYGDISAEWELCASPEGSGLPRLAAAVDRALLEAVRNAVGRSRLRLTSVQPYLTAAYNGFERRRRETDFVFIAIEARRICILAAQSRVWRYVSAAATADNPAELAESLEREIRLAGVNDGTPPAVFIHAAHGSQLTLPALLGKPPHLLSGKFPAGLSPTIDRAFVMPALTV